MQTLCKPDLEPLFNRLRDVFLANRDNLIELDGKVGDGDLGLTMCKAFSATSLVVSEHGADGIGRTLQLAGLAAAKAAPSTMGTLVATGLMRGGKALEHVEAIGTAEMSLFWTAFLNGVMERGKARRGDKTAVDVLAPVAESLAASAEAGLPLEDALVKAARAAAEGLEATRGMMAEHGKAACFREKTIGLPDAGATVIVLMVETFSACVNTDRPGASPARGDAG
jgi:dihydroxyacetone kinase-like protein